VFVHVNAYSHTCISTINQVKQSHYIDFVSPLVLRYVETDLTWSFHLAERPLTYTACELYGGYHHELGIQLGCVTPLAVPHSEYTLVFVHCVAYIREPSGRNQYREVSEYHLSPREELWMDSRFQWVKRS
jgi:hypothetical protein